VPIPVLLGAAGLLLVVAGLVCLGAAVRRWRRDRHIAGTHASAKGRLADRYLPPGGATGAQGPSYTIDFITPRGQAVRLITDSVGWRPKHVGDDVEVLYDANNPKDAVVRGGDRFAASMMSIAGIVFLIVGLLFSLRALDHVLP
jgi:hypothetical protein